MKPLAFTRADAQAFVDYVRRASQEALKPEALKGAALDALAYAAVDGVATASKCGHAVRVAKHLVYVILP